MPNTWGQMREEFQIANAPGLMWIEELQTIAARKIRKLREVPPATFGLTAWDRDELVQIVLVERLLGRKQAFYIFEVAETIDDARRLLTVELDFALEKLRVPNQVDNIWRNLEPKLQARGWSLRSKTFNSESEEELTEKIVALVLNQKRLKNLGIERLSPLFASGVLENLAAEIIKLEPEISSNLIRKALRTALTIISPAMSIETVGTSEDEYRKALEGKDFSTSDVQYGGEEMEIATIFLEKLDVESLEICFHLANRSTQSEIAAVLGVSRPTAIKRIAETSKLLTDLLNSLTLNDQERVKVIMAMFDRIGYGLIEGKLSR